MDLNLSGQTVAIVGGAKGIGAAISAGFAAEGCRVCGFDVQGDAARNIVAGDVSDYASVRNFASISARLGSGVP